MITLYVEKLYRYPRLGEHMSAAVSFPPGALRDTDQVRVLDGEKELPVQCRATARYGDGSVKYLFVRFMGDLPGNAGKEFRLSWEPGMRTGGQGAQRAAGDDFRPQIRMRETDGGYEVCSGPLEFRVDHGGDRLFSFLSDGCRQYEGGCFDGPVLKVRTKDGESDSFANTFGRWQAAEMGPLCVILKNKGVHTGNGRRISFEVKLTAYAAKPWAEVSYRVINTSEKELDVGSLGFFIRAEEEKPACKEAGTVYRTRGTAELGRLEELCPPDRVRTCTGYSNYKTDFQIGADGAPVTERADSARLMREGNEHFTEVLYGTMFADRTDERGGICATVYQAAQNYPKAVTADQKGIAVMLVPEGEDRVILQPGMSREQRFLLHFHGPGEPLAELDSRSLMYQMPDRPAIDPGVFKAAGVMPDVFPGKIDPETEILLIRRADGHNRAFGMLNWGDSMDQNYTSQGRGGGKPVWVNNEYDYPHACAVMYARTGTRRFLDYLLVSASHWMDVDICHYSSDPLRQGGQVEHTNGHVVNGSIVPSHEWVEGLLDYYHFSGDERGLECAVGIGENVLRLLDTPAYSVPGEVGARETGWALRTLTALYLETGEERWLEKGQWIVEQFEKWEQDYGHWMSVYTDNTLIRVGFMISVAIGSLMRFYRVRPGEELKAMILRAVDDLKENCLLDNGLFYYKELPSLARLGNNTMLLEAMAAGYELTGDRAYLEAGNQTFRQAFWETKCPDFGNRVHIDDAVIWPGDSSKTFAQSFLPLAMYDKAREDAGMR